MRQNPTKAEKVFWSKVRRNSIDGLRIRRQHVIEYSDNFGHKSYFIVDFCCLPKKLIIEIDGKIHELQKEQDLQRTKILEQIGFRVIRFTNEQVSNNWQQVELELRAALNWMDQ